MTCEAVSDRQNLWFRREKVNFRCLKIRFGGARFHRFSCFLYHNALSQGKSTSKFPRHFWKPVFRSHVADCFARRARREERFQEWAARNFLKWIHQFLNQLLLKIRCFLMGKFSVELIEVDLSTFRRHRRTTVISCFSWNRGLWETLFLGTRNDPTTLRAAHHSEIIHFWLKLKNKIYHDPLPVRNRAQQHARRTHVALVAPKSAHVAMCISQNGIWDFSLISHRDFMLK